MAGHRPTTVQDYVALVEIDLAGELMIAAAAASEDRLSPDRIDEVLEVDGEGGDGTDRACHRLGPAGCPPG